MDPGRANGELETAKIHLAVLGQHREVEFPVRVGRCAVDALIGPARALSEHVSAIAVEQAEARGERVQCRAGCAACCHHLIPISVVEAISLAAHVEAMPEDRRAAVRARFGRIVKRMEEVGLLDAAAPPGRHALIGRGRDGESAWDEVSRRYFAAGIACPFLEDDRTCGAYAERPMVCREYQVVTPSDWCSELDPRVRSVERPARLSEALADTAARVTGREIASVPLPLALEWAAVHGASWLEPAHDGEELFRALLSELAEDLGLMAQSMRAVRIHAYGGPELLLLDEVERPTPGPRDVLVRVCATSVNPVDWKIRSGGQRNIIRYRLPWILGLDVSGVVEAVGSEVRRFAVGDEVWSSPTHRRPGTYAEHVCIDEREVARKPKSLSHEEAASLPLVGLTAYQCLVEKGRLRAGQSVLIHAGAGGVGTFAIQLAKHLGARVVTTCSARSADFVRSLGADQVVDYTKERLEDVLHDVDLVLDSLGEPAFASNLQVVRRGGRISNITVDVPAHVRRFGTFLSLFTLAFAMLRLHLWPLLCKGVRVRHVIKRCDGEQLQRIADLVDEGAIRPVIDRVLPLAEVQEAHRHSESHHARGKIVLRVATLSLIAWLAGCSLVAPERTEYQTGASTGAGAADSGPTPRTLWSGPGTITSIAVGGDAVYWTVKSAAAASGQIWRLEKAKGTPEPIAGDQDDPNRVAVAAKRIYWTNAGASGPPLMSLDPATETDPKVEAAGPGPGFDVELHQSTPFWTGTDTLFREDTAVTDVGVGIQGVAVGAAASLAYVTNPAQKSLTRIVLNETPVTKRTIDVAPGRPQGIVVVGDFVYWIEESTPGNADGRVSKVGLGENAGPEPVVEDVATGDQLAVDISGIWWANGAVVMHSTNAGETAVVVDGLDWCAGAIAVDDVDVYWGCNDGQVAQLMSLPEPSF